MTARRKESETDESFSENENDTPILTLRKKSRVTDVKELGEKILVESTKSRLGFDSKSYYPRIAESLLSVGNTELYRRIDGCWNRKGREGKFNSICGSPWCNVCRNLLYLRHYSSVIRRINHGRYYWDRFVDDETIISRLSGMWKEEYGRTEYKNGDLFHITGILGLCPVRTEDLQKLIKKDTDRWRRIRRRLNKETEELFWCEAVYEIELVDWRKLKNADESDYKKRQMKFLIDSYDGERFSGEPFLFVHFHGITNMDWERMYKVFDTEYWIDGKRIPKTNERTGLYIQNLHADKLVEENIRKITSYPFKNPLRYKHSYIGSDYRNGEFFEPEELGRLISVYDDLIGRQGRTLFRSVSNDADVWYEIINRWSRLLKYAPKRKIKKLKEDGVFDLILKLTKECRRKGGGNMRTKLTPYITDYLVAKRIRKDASLPWKFKPIRITKKEKFVLEKYRWRNKDIFGLDVSLDWRDLGDAYKEYFINKPKTETESNTDKTEPESIDKRLLEKY